MLTDHALMDTEKASQALAEKFFLPWLELDNIADSSISLTVLPENVMREQQILPLQANDVYIDIAIADPTRTALMHEIGVRLGKPIQWHIVSPEKLASRIARLLHVQAQDDLQANDALIVQYVEKLLSDAVNKRASDIHIESYAKQLRVRFRIDGILYEMAQLPPTLAPRLIAHLKVLAQCDITERRLPQDGRLQVAIGPERQVDCRLSTCPTVHGEKLVLRLLNAAQVNLDIDTLGLTESQKNLFLHALKKPQGMVLVTGPTGSGKTITLYTALHLLNQPGVNIASAEDPVEIELPGINQVPIHAKIGLTFAKTLRAFLRQDPDILMVGEMRDAETADIAVKAAQTGHLVLSTLHTNSAAETLTRLLNMNIPAYHIAASVSLIIAQRLVRCLCAFCKKPERSRQGFHAVGCSKCQAGYSGRTAIYELLPITSAIINSILQHANAVALAEQARAEGMQTLAENGLQKIHSGITSHAELLRVLQ